MRKLSVALAVAAMFAAPSANAAAVTTDIQLSILIQGLDSVSLTLSSVSVDVTGSTVTVPGAAVTGLGIVVPVTATTSIAQISANTIGIAGGTFSASGVSNQLPSEVCVAAGGEACNSGGSNIGGAMGLVGAVNVAVIPNVVVIPVALSAALVGQGGSTNTPFTFDAAGWTTGAASVNTGTNVVATSGGASPLTLVTPTFVSALGNLLPLFTTMVLTNVSIPEPGTLLLLGAGVAGLVAVGRRRS
jgi:hypothetical protein